jgi:hypothetical protein
MPSPGAPRGRSRASLPAAGYGAPRLRDCPPVPFPAMGGLHRPPRARIPGSTGRPGAGGPALGRSLDTSGGAPRGPSPHPLAVAVLGTFRPLPTRPELASLVEACTAEQATHLRLGALAPKDVKGVVSEAVGGSPVSACASHGRAAAGARQGRRGTSPASARCTLDRDAETVVVAPARLHELQVVLVEKEVRGPAERKSVRL